MLKRLFMFCLSIVCVLTPLLAQSDWLEWNEDIAAPEELAGWQEKYEELSEIAEHPFNINTITKEELEQLPFLSDRMIENILYYIYKYGPMLTKNELLGIEGMDWQTRKFLTDFIYIGPSDNEKDRLKWKNLWKYNKQELLTRLDIPFNTKAGYAGYDEETLAESPNKRYYGDPFYHNIRYRFQYRNQIYIGLTAEKDAGEPFFVRYNRKGYDSYSGYVFLSNFKRLKTLAIGNFKANFGYGLVLNIGSFTLGKGMINQNRFGQGFTKYTSVGEGEYLQGIAATYQLGRRWNVSAFYSFRKQDARVENGFIRSLKTDGYHRLKKDMEKKHTVSNHLTGCNLTYNGKYTEFGLTAVYNRFNKMLNPDARDYNLYYPRGMYFYNAGVYYKFFLNRFTFSGETAVDKHGKVATLHALCYQPAVHTNILLIHRYYDKRYQSLYGNAFGENSKLQNETGAYLGLETSFLGQFKFLCYGDFFHFFYRKYQVDRDNTSGFDGLCQLSYSPSNSLSMLIKYTYKNKAKNYTSPDETKFVLPYVRQRLHYQCSYAPSVYLSLKGVGEGVMTSYNGREKSKGGYVSGTVKGSIPPIPVQVSLTGTWFHTQDYNSRIYVYEPGLLYAFSMNSFYGKGTRMAINLKYTWKNRLMIQAKWGWTHYQDRNRISSGTEEIQGSDKADLQVQVRLKW